MAKKEPCGLTDCGNTLGPGAAEVGYMTEGGALSKLRVCHQHAWMLMTAPPGSYRITGKLKLEPIKAKRHII